MAITGRIFGEQEWHPFQPEYEDNRNPAVNGGDPLLLEIRYVSPQRNRKYFESVQMKRKGKLKDGELGRISKLKFIENVKVISGWLLSDESGKERLCTDINLFWAWCPEELLTEIDDAMGDSKILVSGDPKNFKE
jgi:hypothetical protein